MMATSENKICLPSSGEWFNSYIGNLHSQWKPISLTYGTFPENDIIGKIFAWSSLLPIFILVAFISLIMFRREVHTILLFLGILFNEVINVGLKRYFKAPRPC